MKPLIAVFLIVALFATTSVAQDQQVRHRSGPRRQLATIVFAGLGGAILGLSTLSFYGRPQDQLSNIAIGFAVGVIVGTVYVTFKSATSRDYYDERPNPQGRLLLPEADLIAETEISNPEPTETQHWQWGPLISRVQNAPASTNNAYGGQVQFQF